MQDDKAIPQDDKAIQEDLDRAQADLEAKVGQLKTVVMGKLETPKRIISVVERAVALVRAHPALLAGAVAGALLILRLRRRRRLALAHPR